MTRLIQVFTKIRNAGFGRDIATVALGSFGSQMIAILAAPILMRIYSPSEFGVMAVCTSLLFVVVAASLRFNQAIPLPAANEDAASISQLALVILLLMTALVGSFFLIFGDSVAALTNTPAIIDLLWSLPIIFLFSGISEVLLSVSIRTERFRVLAYAQIAQSTSQVIYQIGAGFIDPNLKHLIIGIIIGNTVATVIYGLDLYKIEPRQFKSLPFVDLISLWRIAKTYRNFPLLATPSALINSASTQIVPLLLATFYSTSVVGWLALAQRVIGLPITTIGYGVSQVFFQRSAKLQQQSPAELLDLYRKTAHSLFFICIIPLGLLAFFAPFLFSIIFGEQWKQSGDYVILLVPMFISQFVVSPLSLITAVISAQKLQLIWDLSRLVSISVLIFVSAMFELSAAICIFTYSLGMTANYVSLYFLTIRAIKKRF